MQTQSSKHIKASFGISLVLAVLFLNYIFAQDFFGYGLVNEDIPYLRDYKADNRIVDNNYLVRVYKTWVHTGLGWAHQILYAGTLDELFPYNWELTHKLNFIWKILAALSIYPTLWVLTKRKFLATLATLIYAILPSANGSLQINVTGTEYWGVIFLNLFIISYYFLIRDQKNIKLLVLSFILLYVAIFSAPMRMIPTFILLVIMEIIIAIKGISKFKTTILRIIIYLVPFYLLFRLVDPGTFARGNSYNNLLKDLFAGNWQLLINPLAGLGFTLINPDSVRFFGIWNLRTLESYFGNLFGRGIIPLFLIFTFVLAPVISQKPKRFIITTFILSTFFQILIYIFDTHYYYIPKELALPYNGTLDFATLPGILGAYIIAIALATGFEWYKTGMKDKILLAVFISPLLSLSFICATWLSIGKHFGYEGPVHRYLTVPAIGVSIFISSILILIFKRIQTSKRTAGLYAFFLVIFLIYLVVFSYKGNQYFKMIKSLGEDMAVQKHIQEVFFNTTPASKRDNLILYYEPRLVTVEDRYWYTALNYGRITLWVFLHKYYNKPDRKVNGCLDWVDNGFNEFKKIYKYSNNQVTFNSITAFCTKDSVLYSGTHTFYQDDFFAFTLKGDQVVDITKEVLERLHKELDNNTNPL
ncbi:MAG: hypothetical protein G01um10147_29 [Microgenomates group bacterium Gr01-1014_7]|nr:MAG: hypothetical protein G01um10147_29 [Microgenomates group bacterium Gr01-1014_7]